MPRDGSGIYHRPVGTDAVPDTTVESTKYNTNVADVETDLNTPRPIVAGGTGGSNAIQAISNLGAEIAKVQVVNYSSAVWQSGSFYSLTTATAPPVAGHAFVGTVLQQDANNMMLVAQDLSDTVDPGRVWAREMTAGVWGNWTMVSDPYIQSALPTNPRVGQLWWDTVSGLLYVYFDDGTSKQWVATSPLTAPGATLDFPTSPSVGTKFPAGSQAWTWDGSKWTPTAGATPGKTPIYTDGSTTMGAQLTLFADPVNPTHAADKNYVDNLTTSAAAGKVRYDTAQSLTAPQKAQAQTNIGLSNTPVLRGELGGLTLSTPGASTTFSVAVGMAADSTVTDYLALASAISKTSASWAVGSGNGALDTGAIAISTWYHVYVIKRTDTGVTDVLISLQPTAATPNGTPTLPTNYTLFRRIGAMRFSAASQWVTFSQNGDEFLWAVRNFDANNVALNSGARQSTPTLLVPPGVQVNALIGLSVAGTNVGALVTSPDETDQVASATTGGGIDARATAAGDLGAANLSIRTDTSSKVFIRSNAGGNYYISTKGWIDRRGKDA